VDGLSLSDDVVEEEPKTQKLAISVTLASKENPTIEPSKEVSMVNPPKKTTTEAKSKRQKKQTSRPELSLEQHQTSSSLVDVSASHCFSFRVILVCIVSEVSASPFSHSCKDS
jgi:hypothetical protein